MSKPSATGLEPVGPPRERRRLERNLAVLCAIRFLFWAHFWGAVLTPFYTQWGGLKLSQVFLLNAWFMLCGFGLEAPTGGIADRWGRRVSLALGGMAALAGVLVYVSAPSLPRFALGELLLAAAYALHSGADEALAFDTLKALDRSSSAPRFLARLEACKLAGINVGTLAGAAIAAHWGLRAPMLAYAGPAVLVSLFALALHEAPHEGGSRRDYWATVGGGLRDFCRQPALRAMAIELAITNALAWGVIWLFQPALAARGLSLKWFGAVHALACLGQIGFLAAVERLESWSGSRRRLLNGATLLAGLALILLAWGRSLWLVIPAVVAAFTFSLPRVVIYAACLNRFIPSERRATMLSVASMLRTIAIVVVNPLTGWLADWSLAGTLTFLGAGLALSPFLSRVPAAYFERSGGDLSAGDAG